MPTTQIKRIDTSGAGDYTSLSAWEAAEQADLVAGDLIKVALCIGGFPADLNQCTLAGWTTDDTRYIKIQGDRQIQPISPAGVYQIRGAVALTTGVLRATNFGGADNVWIDGIQVTSRNAACDGIRQNITSGTGWWKISRCIVTSTRFDNNGAVGIDLFGSKTYYVWNNLVYLYGNQFGIPGNPTGGITVQSGGANAYLYANTVAESYEAIRGADLTRCFNNCIRRFGQAGGGAFTTATTFHADSGFNAYEPPDAFAPGVNNSRGVITFVGDVMATIDYHLSTTDMTARRQGADLSGGPITFFDDMEGTLRGAVWDIGCDQIATEVSAPPDAVRVLDDEGVRWMRWKNGGTLPRLTNSGSGIEGGGPDDPGGGGEFGG